MDEALNKIMNGIPQQGQRQYSLEEQLRVLWSVANMLGLYDAADFLVNPRVVMRLERDSQEAGKQ